MHSKLVQRYFYVCVTAVMSKVLSSVVADSFKVIICFIGIILCYILHIRYSDSLVVKHKVQWVYAEGHSTYIMQC